MLAFNYKINYYEDEMKKAIYYLKEEDYQVAREHIYNIMIEKDSYPQGHNLLGIMYELKGDLELARKHYRASYSLDPTFKAADNNLERISTFIYNLNSDEIDYGDRINNNKKDYYVLKYDSNNIGRLVKI